MKFDAALLQNVLERVPRLAREAEDAGLDGIFTFEGPNEPFLPLALAAEHTTRLELGTGLAIAFARTPMTLANLAHDLQVYSKGRVLLGLGTQIRAHVERRYGLAYGDPYARMREFVEATRAIFACWNEGRELAHAGRYYTHTLMPPMFRPTPSPSGAPPILLGGVGPKAIEVAGEVADGLVVHPFHTGRSLEAVVRPALARGHARRAPRDAAFTHQVQVMVGLAADEAELARAREAVRAQIAFYASTPAYESVLAAEGLEDLRPHLQRILRTGRWDELAREVPASLVESVAILGTPTDVAQALHARYGSFASRIAFASPFPLEASRLAEVIEAYRALPETSSVSESARCVAGPASEGA